MQVHALHPRTGRQESPPTYKHVNDVAITFKTGTRINILEPKNLHEGASATYKEIFKKKYVNHVKRKYSLEENTFKSFFLIIG